VTKTAAVLDIAPQLRRDAAQNRRLLLDAAASVFADRGLDAGVEEIAKAAGVGVGTLYRRFPTKDALIAELVKDVLETMRQLATAATDQAGGNGLEWFLESSCAYQAAHIGCLPRLWNSDSDNETVREVRRIIAALLEDAQRHGTMRAELTSTDVTMVMWSIRGVIETTRGIAPDAWRRQLDILLAGLRPASQPLSHRPLTRAAVDRILADPSPPRPLPPTAAAPSRRR
jgi:AcrR family transcriptional regulator